MRKKIPEYRAANNEIGKWLNYVFGLPFLEPNEVPDCFSMDLMSTQPNCSRAVEFSDYLVENYIDEEAMFPPKNWASCISSITRTINCCESFHSKFNECFYKPHPSLYVFIKILSNFQTETYIKIERVQEPVRCKDSKTKKKTGILRTKNR
nr:unnamed protein product [Callosobruchus analis]